MVRKRIALLALMVFALMLGAIPGLAQTDTTSASSSTTTTMSRSRSTTVTGRARNLKGNTSTGDEIVGTEPCGNTLSNMPPGNAT